MCNEVVRELDFAAQCAFARQHDYDGLEVAPFTLADDPTRMPPGRIAELRAIAKSEGTRISGLHWLLAAPAGLSITTTDPAVFDATGDAGRRLVDLCAGLGGAYVVHGSPKQRQLTPGDEARSRQQAMRYFTQVAQAASDAGVAYVLEPLSRIDTGLAASVEEAVAIVDQVAQSSFTTMIDCYAVAANGDDVVAQLDRWLPSGHISHVHFNDDNMGGPGQGGIDFGAVVQALARHAYRGQSAIEPFVCLPDGHECAAQSIAHIRKLEAIEIERCSGRQQAGGVGF